MIAVASIVLSLMAVGFSIFAFMEGRHRYKMDLFLKIHELMISEDSYRGRQLLLSGEYDEASIKNLPHSEHAKISRTLALYDTLGLYFQRGYLIERDVISMWGDPAYRAWNAAEPFVARRARQASHADAYPYFHYLYKSAEASRKTADTMSGDA